MLQTNGLYLEADSCTQLAINSTKNKKERPAPPRMKYSHDLNLFGSDLLILWIVVSILFNEDWKEGSSCRSLMFCASISFVKSIATFFKVFSLAVKTCPSSSS
uniref:Uncharacterized protein n=1 Tax=Encephalitozoon cuniculi TaxID=6035 RepID=M1JKS1_ENCCN|nr:hypothetical protein ECU01_0300 [Encephalitozoon cuniculi]